MAHTKMLKMIMVYLALQCLLSVFSSLRMSSAFGESPSTFLMLLPFGISFFYILLFLLIAYGLWKHKRWGWIWGRILFGLIALALVLNIVISWETPLKAVVFIIWTIWHGAMTYYLFSNSPYLEQSTPPQKSG
ncbi:MAG: hypothetical protein HQM12_11595 [SAR324 cluster bacterium]|nr:hypothetical protein [SAR324 cluster bacterium]